MTTGISDEWEEEKESEVFCYIPVLSPTEGWEGERENEVFCLLYTGAI